MRKQPRIKSEPLFRRRIIITIPPWGVPVIALGIAIGTFTQLQTFYIAIMTILVAASVVATCALYRMVQDIRSSVHNILHDIENENMSYQEIEEAANQNGSGNARISVRK